MDDETIEAGDNGTYYITYHYVLEGELLTVQMLGDNSSQSLGRALGRTDRPDRGLDAAPLRSRSGGRPLWPSR